MSKLRTKAHEAIMLCCETTCGSKQPITEYLIKLERIRELVMQGNFESAKELADEIN